MFDALGVARREIHHSNFLAFLLDPAEAHGQSQLFLRAVLIDILKSLPHVARPLSPLDLDGAELRGVDVRREWNNIDLLITSKEPRFVIAIENKVDAGEHSNQLARYKTAIAENFPGVPALFLFLTPTGEEPSEAEWQPYTYKDIHRVLSRVRASNEGAIGDDVLLFLDHYLNLIGTRLMNDERIDELCERIWKNHRVALQLIYDRVGSPGAGIQDTAERAVRSDTEWHCFYGAGGSVDFIPADWVHWVPDVGIDYKKHPKSWIICRFQVDGEKLVFYIEIRRTQDASVRTGVVKALLAETNNFGFIKPRKRSVLGDQYTRVTGKDVLLEWDAESMPSTDVVSVAVKKKLAEIRPKLPAIADAVQKVLHHGSRDETPDLGEASITK